MKKIVIIIGTRPEAIKLIPVYLAFQNTNSFDVKILSTGQHKEMLIQIFSFFELHPHVQLDLMTKNQSLSEITASLFTNLHQEIQNLNPDLIIVQGDTTTAMVAAMVGFYNQVRIAHVEAGLRSYKKYAPFPEEINRRIISQIADWNFAPTTTASENLEKELKQNIYNVGNTVIDSLFIALARIKDLKREYDLKFKNIINKDRRFILITFHRRESFGDALLNICDAICALAIRFVELDFIFPVHLNPNVSKPVHQKMDSISNILLLNPLPYDEMVYVMSQSYIILTDSGGIQEEAPSLNKPLIVLRDVTERPEGIDAGCAVLGGTQAESIKTCFIRLYENPLIYAKMSNSINPYGDGKSSLSIADIIKKTL